MVKIINFTPTRNRPSGLKDDIKFSITELAPFEPNSAFLLNIPKMDETTFLRLTDLEAQEFATKDSILYINVSPDTTTSKVLIDNLSLSTATHQQIIDEVQRVSPIRESVRKNPSSFVALEFAGKTILNQAEKLDASISSPLSYSRSTKGKILDIASGFKTYKAAADKAFTNLVIGADTRITEVQEVLTGTTIRVASAIGFQVDGFITIINPRYFLDGAVQNNFLTIPNDFPPRDVLLFRIKTVTIQVGFAAILELLPTSLSPLLTSTSLFSSPEMESINVTKDRALATSGVPVLLREKSISSSVSLLEAEKIIESEIPDTRLYAPKTPQPNGQAQFIGNLDRSTLAVVMEDDDNEVSLIKAGIAQPGISVDYKLVTEKGTSNYGNVDVTIRLSSSPAKAPTSGVSSIGATAIRLGARIASTPGRLNQLGAAAADSNALERAIGVDALKEIAIASKNFSQKDLDASEFYFNHQLRTSTGELVNLNKYGTIRILDKITIRWKVNNQEKILQAVIKGVDERNSLIILDRPLTSDIPSGAVVEVPQTPLNPGRRYRISISCQDRDGPSTTPSIPTSSLTSPVGS